jgi:hypothetical protein
MASIIDQLIFLWSIEKGYVSITALRDPPESDELQKKIEETNDLILTDPTKEAIETRGQDDDPDRNERGDERTTEPTTPRRRTTNDVHPGSHEAGAADGRETVEGEAHQGHPLPR